MNSMVGHPAVHDVFGTVVVVVGAIATLLTIAAATYWTVYPGETDPGHPKRLVLKDDR